MKTFLIPLSKFLAALWLLLTVGPVTLPASPLELHARHRVESAPGSGDWKVVEEKVALDPRGTALVVCDMWDKHWCRGATRRVAEMAPRMNRVLAAARDQGALIIHCPSDTMEHYDGTPQRRLAQAAPKVETKIPLQNWCHLDASQEAPLPIDDSDGGCDCDPPCENYKAWSKQIGALEIHENDAVTDSAEAYYLMKQRGITNVVVMGVHLNMCVLGRPFSIRQMVNQGQNVYLVRDLTDTMYNSRKHPYVPHCVGNDLMVEHVEKYWCASVASTDFIGGEPFRFAEDRRPHVVFMIGEDEYETWETLPAFADSVLRKRGFRVTVAHASPEDKNRFPGFVEAARAADLLFVSVRRRSPPREVLEAIRAHLDAGKPLIGLRTASHAFALRNQKEEDMPADGSRAMWLRFDPEVLGGNYHNHHGNGPLTALSASEGAGDHSILTGVDLDSFRSRASLYKVRPLEDGAVPLIMGTIPGQPSEPVAWTHRYGDENARVFYTSLGHPTDFDEPAFQRLLLNGIHWTLDLAVPPAAFSLEDKEKKFATAWQPIAVPGTWEDLENLRHDGVAWYRCLVRVPASWLSAPLQLTVEQVDNAHEAFFNGARLGGAGAFPPQYRNGLDEPKTYDIPPEKIRVGEWNVVALRVYDHEGRGGFKGEAPWLLNGRQGIRLAGEWQLRIGDDPSWADVAAQDVRGNALHHSVQAYTGQPAAAAASAADIPEPLRAREALRTFTVPDDLQLDLILAEPDIAQPLQISFDERGRLWVVEYRQYPAPAGLELMSHDEYWRAVYDQVPAPPPHHVRGKDRISIHEDTDGDGTYDRHKVFVDGLNIATSCAVSGEGVWVLNPPYLLFYADRNRDDVPDGDPDVHLSGFGLEDTHSVANSLRWGPDGWLYAAQGSTVSAKVKVEKLPGEDGQPDPEIHYSQGQNIWRYHPATRRYEIFAEGGGNAFGVEIDSRGRTFSGHNGGDTRGFHYMQGAYLRKGFNKHGALSNPHAFGYFPHMPHHAVERFTHTFLIYEENALPEPYRGRLFGVEPLQGRVVMSDIQPLGSTFRTEDLSRPVTTTDRWFKPVDIKAGPDGAIYIADWYDYQVNHWRNYQGNMDASNGRVYRLRASDSELRAPFDLRQRSDEALVECLLHESRWWRETAARLLEERADAGLVAMLQKRFEEAEGERALDVFWALYRCAAAVRNSGSSPAPDRDIFPEAVWKRALAHDRPHIRAWAVRLLGDEQRVTPTMAAELESLAAREPDIEVRAQLACTAQRLPVAQALPVVKNLLARDEDASDLRQPLLLWWALESKADSDREAVLHLFADSTVWNWDLVGDHILSRVMKRYAATGTREDLTACARLLEMAPDRAHALALMEGFEEAFQGRSLSGLPETLVAAMAERDLGSPAFQLRRGQPGAVAHALQVMADPQADAAQRRAFVEVMGEVHRPGSIPVLLDLVRKEQDTQLRKAALVALMKYSQPEIGQEVVRLYSTLPEAVRTAADSLLVSRSCWAVPFLHAMERGDIDPKSLPAEAVRKLRVHQDVELQKLAAKLWRETHAATAGELNAAMQRLRRVVEEGKGNPYHGKQLYDTACAACHQLFDEGGAIGPDLTAYQRTDLDNVLLNILHPNAEIREGFENFLVRTKDGRALSGFVADQDLKVVVLRGLDGQNLTLSRAEIAEMSSTGLSLMPEGLLEGWDDQQVRDFFAYFRSSQPLP